MSVSVKKSLYCLLALLLLCFSACAAQPSAESGGSLPDSAPDAQTAVLTVSATSTDTQPTDIEITAEAPSAAERIAAAMTVDYDAEQFAHNEASIFIALLAAHWEPIYILSQWDDYFAVNDLELELNDARYGSGKARFRGVSLDEMLTVDAADMFYVDAIVAYDREGHYYALTRDELIEKEVYLMGYCEDKLFGFPKDGGAGPLVMMSTKDGKAEIIGINIVNISIRRSIDPSSTAYASW